MTAAVASHHTSLWHSRPNQSLHIPNMNMSGLVSTYDASPRTVTHPPTTKAYQPTTSHMDMSMPLFPTHVNTTMMPYQSAAYAFNPLSVSPYNMPQAFPVSYPQAISHPVSYAGTSNVQQMPTVRDQPHAFPIERSPPVKAESSSPVQSSPAYNESSYGDFKRSNSEPEDGSSINFTTDVDTLMKAIQAKQQPAPPQQQRPQPPKVRDIITHNVPLPTRDPLPEQEVEVVKTAQKPKKRYQCSMPDCHKSFYQKTHLEIHTRAHTGVKPFLCKEPSCGQRFSQLGNLKTHERRHTGERPYRCDICGKTFAQRGNVRAHKIVHQQIKPFTCRLDDCGKQFTQLGNLKSHQNKFHANTLRYLTSRFASVNTDAYVSENDKELWEYFASLYKNSNKGIKGRGKDRRISAATNSVTSSSSSYTSATVTSLNRSYDGSYQYSGSDRSSRSTSLTSEAAPNANHGYNFNTPMQQTGFQSQPNGYHDMVFPERKMYS